MNRGIFDTRTVTCPTHGLRYDPTSSSGCIRCRASARPPPPAPPAPSTARRNALAAVLAVLLLGSGGWLAYERFAAPKAEPRAFSQREVLDEARRVHIVIYSAIWCESCEAAKTFLWKNEIPYEEHDIDKEKDARDRWMTLNPQKTIPVIDVEGDIVVGADPKPIVEALVRASQRHLATARSAPAGAPAP